MSRPIRLDDLGASSKQFEWWSRHRWANVWPLHHRRLFGAWGPYRELTVDELDSILRIVGIYRGTIILAITACWVERDGTLTPYGEKFPQQARLISWWAKHGVQVAAHGLTHCVPGQHLPRWIGGNRPWHREKFIQSKRAMETLARDLDVSVTRYVAPGEPAGTTNEIIFHDRDFVLDWKGTMRKLHEALA